MSFSKIILDNFIDIEHWHNHAYTSKFELPSAQTNYKELEETINFWSNFFISEKAFLGFNESVYDLRDKLLAAYKQCHILRAATEFSCLNQELGPLMSKLQQEKEEQDRIRRILVLNYKIFGILQQRENKTFSQNHEAQSLYECSQKLRDKYSFFRESELKQIKLGTAEKSINFVRNSYPEFLQNLTLPLLQYIEDKKDLLLFQPQTEAILNQKNINPFFMFMAWHCQPQLRQDKISQADDFQLFWQQFRHYLNYIIYYMEIQAAKPEPPLLSHKVDPYNLLAIIKKRRANPRDRSSQRILAAATKYPKQKGRDISPSSLRDWFGRNKIYYEKFRDSSVEEIVLNMEKDDIVNWFENLKWLDPLFRQQLDKFLTSK